MGTTPQRTTSPPGDGLAPPLWLTFDCYGTLIDWEAGIRRSFRDLCRIDPGQEMELVSLWEKIQWEKIQGPYVPYAEIMQSSFSDALNQMGYSSASHSEQAFLESLGRWEPFSDVNPALSALAQRHKLAIISNIDRELLGWTLRQLNVRFDALITAEDAHCYKPNAEVFRFALARLGCAPERIAHIAFGAEYDLGPAASVGMRLVYVNRKGLPRPDLPLEAEVGTLDELVGFWKIPAKPRKAAAPRRKNTKASRAAKPSLDH